jgi:5-methylcytosine-specific restriction endonuclease McrA
VSIDHLNGKAAFCPGDCRNKWYVANDREGYNAKARAWQSSEKGKAYRRAYQQANAEQRQRWARDSRAKDPARYYRYWRQWVEANPEAAAENGRRRRARKIGNPGSVGVSVRDWGRLVARYRGCCAYCGEKAEPLHMDHVVPLAKGGRHGIGNVLPACGRCNVRKHAMFLSVWRYRGRRLLLGV